MKKMIKVFLCVGLIFVLTACGSKLNYEMFTEGEKTVYVIEEVKYVESDEATNLVKIEVDGYGIMIAELYPEIAPITVANFQKLVSEKFYDGLTFHRVIKDFMIQTGDPTATGGGGSDENIKGEFELNGFTNELSHTRGVLSMARRGANPDTEETMNSASSQFFIVHADSVYLDGMYASFGKVINGLDVIDSVAVTVTDAYDKPINDQVIKTIRFVSKYEG